MLVVWTRCQSKRPMDSRPCAACQSTKPATSSAQELQQQQRQQTTAVIVLVCNGRRRSHKVCIGLTDLLIGLQGRQKVGEGLTDSLMVLQILQLVLMVGKWSHKVLQIHRRSAMVAQGLQRSQQVKHITHNTLYARTAHTGSKGAGIPLARSTEQHSVPTKQGRAHP